MLASNGRESVQTLARRGYEVNHKVLLPAATERASTACWVVADGSALRQSSSHSLARSRPSPRRPRRWPRRRRRPLRRPPSRRRGRRRRSPPSRRRPRRLPPPSRRHHRRRRQRPARPLSRQATSSTPSRLESRAPRRRSAHWERGTRVNVPTHSQLTRALSRGVPYTHLNPVAGPTAGTRRARAPRFRRRNASA